MTTIKICRPGIGHMWNVTVDDQHAISSPSEALAAQEVIDRVRMAGGRATVVYEDLGGMDVRRARLDHPGLDVPERIEITTLAALAEARQARGQALRRMTKATLCALYRRGVTHPDLSTTRYVGGAHPPESWRKDEVISSLLDAEFRWWEQRLSHNQEGS